MSRAALILAVAVFVFALLAFAIAYQLGKKALSPEANHAGIVVSIGGRS